MNVFYYMSQVLLCLNEYGFITSSKQSPISFMLTVISLSVNSIYMPHESGQISFRGVNNNMTMVAHKAISRNVHIEQAARFFKHIYEKLVII